MQRSDNKYYLLILLIVISAVSHLDRFVLALVLEPIKQDLQLSDSQLGLMTGFAFAFFFAVAGVPIARWADSGNRITISALAAGLVGVGVALCGMASNFIQLLIPRAGIAIGQAGTVPTAQSLISDRFVRAQRPRAMATYFMGYIASMFIGYLVGGWLVESYGWRITFILLGVPSVVAALLTHFTLKETRQAQPEKEHKPSPPLLQTFTTLWQQKTYRYIFIGFCASYFVEMGVNQWLATFFIRTHEMSSAEVGAWFAFIWGGGGIAGHFVGGYVATHYGAHKEQLQFRGIALLSVVSVIFYLLLYLTANKSVALFAMTVIAFASTAGVGCIFAGLQSLVAEKMRSISVALIFLFCNLIGFGLGPFMLGMVSDLLSTSFQQDSLRYALILFSPGGLVVAYYFWRASQFIEMDIAATETHAASMLYDPETSNQNSLPKSAAVADS